MPRAASAWRMPRSVASDTSGSARPRIRTYAAVQAPILFLVAGEDRIASSRAIEDFAERLKLAKHVVIPHARHEIMQERDELRQQFWAAFDAYVGCEQTTS